NEWPLYVLQRSARARNFQAVEEALRQVQKARFFLRSEVPEAPRDGIVTIDLSLRNLLAPSVVKSVVSRLTDAPFTRGLHQQDPMLRNRQALLHPQVVERLCFVLARAAQRFGHTTMRQLVGFVAFLLTGGQSATDRLRADQDFLGLSYFNL